MLQRTTFVLVVVMSLAASALTADDAPFFPLMAWDYVDDEETLAKMADCGINSVAFVPEKMLDACQKHGIRAILYDPALAGERWDAAFVVGDFTHEDGSRWVMIVNKVPGRSIMCLPEFRHPVKLCQYVDPVSGGLRPYPDGLYALAPGQGVLLKLEGSY